MYKRLIVALCVMAAAEGAFAAEAPRGSDIVRLGMQEVLTGTLKEDGSEWRLIAANTEELAVHLDNYEVVCPKGIALTDGDSAMRTASPCGPERARDDPQPAGPAQNNLFRENRERGSTLSGARRRRYTAGAVHGMNCLTAKRCCNRRQVSKYFPMY